MKKSIIAASAASLAVAAMPVVGVFADDSTINNNTVVDTLTVTVAGACTLEDSTTGVYTDDDRSFSGSIAAGTVGWLNATSDSATPGDETFTVHCNAATGTWTVAVSASDNALKGSTYETNTNKIDPGTTFSGGTSAWAIKSNAANLGETSVSNPYSDYAAYSSGTFLSAPASTASGVTKATFNPSYKVYVSPDQLADTYTGTVTYTVSYAQ